MLKHNGKTSNIEGLNCSSGHDHCRSICENNMRATAYRNKKQTAIKFIIVFVTQISIDNFKFNDGVFVRPSSQCPSLNQSSIFLSREWPQWQQCTDRFYGHIPHWWSPPLQTQHKKRSGCRRFCTIRVVSLSETLISHMEVDDERLAVVL